jgi:hypothetical protein
MSEITEYRWVISDKCQINLRDGNHLFFPLNCGIKQGFLKATGESESILTNYLNLIVGNNVPGGKNSLAVCQK